jgi:alkylated DNA repair dioxygenase AlkB
MNITDIIPEKDGGYSIIIYIENFLDKECYINSSTHINNIIDWKSGDRDGHPINRLQKWYHIDKKPFSQNWRYEWPRWESHYYEDWIYNIQHIVQTKIENIKESIQDQHKPYIINSFNSALFNYYRNGEDAIGSHRDDIAVLGENNTIACVSFGSPRLFKMKRVIYNPDNLKSLKLNKLQQHMNKDIIVNPGSLLIMAGSVQKFFSHEVPKSTEFIQERQSITLRHV